MPIYLQLINDDTFFWKINVRAFRIGQGNVNIDGSPSEWSFETPQIAVLDTGTSRILVPYSVFPTIIDGILKDKSFLLSNNVYLGPCDYTKYPSVFV